MAVSLMRNGLSAENSIFSQKPSIKVGRSKFDLSRLNCFTGDIGELIPVDIIPTLPNDDFDLSCQYQVDFRPMITPSFTPYKVKVHYYYCRMSDLWQGWNSFISKGRSGKLALTVPTVSTSAFVQSASNFPKVADIVGSSVQIHLDAVGSLFDYLVGSSSGLGTVTDGGVDYNYYPFAVSVASSGYKYLDCNVLPFLMYQKIFRSFYLDPNLMSNGYVTSDVWFPDDLDGSLWRLDYSGSNFDSATGMFAPIGYSSDSVKANFVPVPLLSDSSNSDYADTAVNVLSLRYSQYNDDIFTTALPFLQRGPQTSLDLSSASSLEFDSLIGKGISDFTYSSSGGSASFYGSPSGISFVSGSSFEIPFNRVRIEPGDGLAHTINLDSFSFSGLSQQVVLTAQSLRSLLALSIWQERNALTNGSYQQFIKVHFDDSPNTAYYEPRYIGGTASYFNLSSVVQTSASVDNSPLGTQAGIGQSKNSGSIGHFKSPDFGFIMVLMSIVPDNVYVQNTDHWQIDVNPDDYYMPEYEQLAYQPVLKKQLCVSGSSSDDEVFGYSNRYVYLKQRDSVARGMFALPPSVDSYYSSYVQKRIFTSQPSLSPEFVTCYPPNIDRSFLAVPGEHAFMCQFFSGVKAVRPLSYIAHPNDFGF